MYVLIKKDENFTGIYKDKSEISNKLGVNVKTITRNLKNGRYETDKFLLIIPDFIQNKSKRGGKR